eukprot:scaffold40197_cov33-Tisochrysis_lutea.AAC.2
MMMHQSYEAVEQAVVHALPWRDSVIELLPWHCVQQAITLGPDQVGALSPSSIDRPGRAGDAQLRP